MQLVRDRFIAVALDARKESGEYKDADGDFIRATKSVTTTAAGSVCVVTADGRRLTNVNGPGQGMEQFLRSALKSWDALPESERKPGGLSVDVTGPMDAKRAALVLPAGALVIRVFNRHFGAEESGALRYARHADFIAGTGTSAAERFAEAHNDFMWIPESEWRALVPVDPRVGETQAVPVSFALRLMRFHLDPCRGFSESAAFTRSQPGAGRFALAITKVSADRLSMQLDGSASLTESGRDEPSSYEPRLFGLLEFDRRAGKFARFDMVALGMASGLPRDANGVITPRRGAYPLGIAFELVANPTAAEKLYPRGARDNPTAYLEPKDRR